MIADIHQLPLPGGAQWPVWIILKISGARSTGVSWVSIPTTYASLEQVRSIFAGDVLKVDHDMRKHEADHDAGSPEFMGIMDCTKASAGP